MRKEVCIIFRDRSKTSQERQIKRKGGKKNGRLGSKMFKMR